MYNKTENPYRFKYLETGISGKGIDTVYLPDTPPEEEILLKEENKFVKTELPKDWGKWQKEEETQKVKDPDYVHPKIVEFITREWDRRLNGIWFWNNGKKTYITGTYYWSLCWVRYKFGYQDYRETDKELFYYLKYCEEDPLSYGVVFITIRRYGKSTNMAGWILDPVTRIKDFYVGMQGETDDKISKFYLSNILHPFEKLQDFWKPVVDEASTHRKRLDFFKPARKGRKRPDLDPEDVLESWIDFRPAHSHAYDGEKLYRYLMEEAGKIEKHDIKERWDVVKPCLRDGIFIIGKAFLASTVDLMDIADKGGAAFEEIYYNSDTDKRMKNGQTESGLYACWLPGDCAMKGLYDEYGHPKRKQAREWIINERPDIKDSPRRYAGWVRKYFLTLSEAFYVDSDVCPFNVNILNQRKDELMLEDNMIIRGNFEWKDNKKDGEVRWIPEPVKGKFYTHWLPKTKEETNLVERHSVNREGVVQWQPLNKHKFVIGCDPIQNRIADGARKSTSVAMVKLKYDPLIDGILDDELIVQRALEKYPYKTNKYVVMYDYRPSEPTIFYEDMIKLARFFGCEIHFENQKGAVIDHFITRGYSKFVMSKFISLSEKPTKNSFMTPGTHASVPVIESYTNYLATYIEYFGHTIPFIKAVEDLRKFNPNNPLKHDHTVAMGYTELACVNRKSYEKPMLDLNEVFTQFNNNGNQSILVK